MLKVDFASSDPIPKYSEEAVERLQPHVDLNVIRGKAYAPSELGFSYRLLHHPVALRIARRPGALLHVDHQLLAYLLAPPVRAPTVVTCHDVVTFLPEYDDPSYVSRDRPVQSLYYSLLRRGLVRADRIVADSQHTRADLIRLGYDPRRIDVVPNGVSHDRYRPRSRPECRLVARKYGITADQLIVLHVGTEAPRKNIARLFEAIALVSKKRRAILVKVGQPREPQRSALRRLAASLGISESVIFLDWVDESDLPFLYGAADVFAFPSLYEGFGIPPLEAMACGVPVVVARATSLPEVVGDAGVYIDPADPSGIADAIERVIVDPRLREDLVARGLQQAQRFTWTRTAAGLIETYRRALASAPSG